MTYERRKAEGEEKRNLMEWKRGSEEESYQSSGPQELLRWLNLWFHWKHQSHGKH